MASHQRKMCPWSTASCRVAAASFGLQLNYHASPQAGVDPWFGIGTGTESLILREAQGDNRKSLQGWEILKIQLGLDVPLSRGFVAGPFGAVSLGQYTAASCRGQACATGNGINNTAPHGWILLGLRGAFLP